jgi:hypothetical protein
MRRNGRDTHRHTAKKMGLISVYERYENPRQGKNIKTSIKILALTFNRLPSINGCRPDGLGWCKNLFIWMEPGGVVVKNI